MKQWYALYTKPNAERQVQTALAQHEIETYLPELIPEKTTHKPLFPCYLFMHIDMENTAASRWKWTPGLRRIVSFGGKPVTIPEQIIHQLLVKITELDKNAKDNTFPFDKGETLRVTEGPFADMLAIFEKPVSSQERVQVLVNFLGRLSRTQIDVQHLEKTNAPFPDNNQRKRQRRTRGRGRRIKRH